MRKNTIKPSKAMAVRILILPEVAFTIVSPFNNFSIRILK
ncbi:MAG: hypothetical protein OP8BY_2239 [Candidatus Saccharicenans subterraneus]|uniref:Uncharacterized protein n=1 Tax=Candidatus Saccharicenans subterraneus TaxID=2508984 RepID=A0A3E2BM90_9BACT|nr:MAG: hypothetical protein OP8BY_2239 [Candidatus Saccharicenans subterraneum]